jgi:hypothetical protein
MIFTFATEDPELLKILEYITSLSSKADKLQEESNNKDKTIESLVKDKYTKYGDGYGFLATDSNGRKVWVNSVDTAIRQKDEEIKQLEAKIKKLKE